MRKLFLAILISGLISSISIQAEPLSVDSSDTIQSVLSAHKGKRVTIKLKSGSELTGKVAEVNAELVHLLQLSGKEFYDAVISTGKIEALVIRTKN